MRSFLVRRCSVRRSSTDLVVALAVGVLAVEELPQVGEVLLGAGDDRRGRGIRAVAPCVTGMDRRQAMAPMCRIDLGVDQGLLGAPVVMRMLMRHAAPLCPGWWREAGGKFAAVADH